MPSVSAPNAVDRAVRLYGDLLFDLCETVLWSPSNAQLAFRAIMKEIRRTRSANQYTDHERAWILRIACTQLRAFSMRLGRKLTPSEQIMLDASMTLESRMKQFDSYFHRLSADDQLLLLLRDKYGIPYSEVAAAMGLPEGSLKMKRQQALRTLDEWIWGQA